MKKKNLLVLGVFLLLIGQGFGYGAKKGGIISNFGFGASTISLEYDNLIFKETWTSVALDINIISKEGFSLAFGDLISFEVGTGIAQNLYIGLGYHFLENQWSLGANLVASPDGDDCLVGVKLMGSYWFTESLGLSATLLYGRGVAFSDVSLFNVQAGISVRI
jgi:hypothetical protein